MNSISVWNATAYNKRFGATAAITPQKILCGIERLSPATKVVEAAAAPSRHHVICKRETARYNTKIRKKI